MVPKVVIGHVVKVGLPQLGVRSLTARVDSGAQTSAIWASKVTETERGLEVVFFSKKSKYFTNKTIIFKDYSAVTVVSSNGIADDRFKIKLTAVVNGRRMKVRFTLADRSAQTYPVLIGRNILRGKFIVDVSLGSSGKQRRPRTTK